MPLLAVDQLTKDFGGLRANDHISFRVDPGELVGIIGPNGAGKTTLFNCIAGLHPVTSGQIFFDGRETTSLKAYEVARLGLARTFQVYAAGGDLTVVENVMVGCFLRTRSGVQARSRAEEILDHLQFQYPAHSLVRELPVAAQKLITMATALGTAPKILLLDEIAAGLNADEIGQVMGVIRRIHRDLGITVMLIEHVMALVMNISQRIIVLDSGQKIAEGDPASIARNPRVIAAYLGERLSANMAKGEPAL